MQYFSPIFLLLIGALIIGKVLGSIFHKLAPQTTTKITANKIACWAFNAAVFLLSAVILIPILNHIAPNWTANESNATELLLTANLVFVFCALRVAYQWHENKKDWQPLLLNLAMLPISGSVWSSQLESLSFGKIGGIIVTAIAFLNLATAISQITLIMVDEAEYFYNLKHAKSHPSNPTKQDEAGATDENRQPGKCPNCGAEYSTKFCGDCGTQMDPAQ